MWAHHLVPWNTFSGESTAKGRFSIVWGSWRRRIKWNMGCWSVCKLCYNLRLHAHCDSHQYCTVFSTVARKHIFSVLTNGKYFLYLKLSEDINWPYCKHSTVSYHIAYLQLISQSYFKEKSGVQGRHSCFWVLGLYFVFIGVFNTSIKSAHYVCLINIWFVISF